MAQSVILWSLASRYPKRKFHPFTLGLILAAIVPAAAAHADCVSPAAWQANVERASSALQIVDAAALPDDAREAVAVFYNQIPPPHTIMPDLAVQLMAKSRKYGLPFPYVLIGFFRHGCEIGILQLPVSVSSEGGSE